MAADQLKGAHPSARTCFMINMVPADDFLRACHTGNAGYVEDRLGCFNLEDGIEDGG